MSITKKKPMALEQLIVITVSVVSGGGWFISKLFGRVHEIDNRLDRMPIEYVMKSDYIRDMHYMSEEFKTINAKLDKLVDKLLEK